MGLPEERRQESLQDVEIGLVAEDGLDGPIEGDDLSTWFFLHDVVLFYQEYADLG